MSTPPSPSHEVDSSSSSSLSSSSSSHSNSHDSHPPSSHSPSSQPGQDDDHNRDDEEDSHPARRKSRSPETESKNDSHPSSSSSSSSSHHAPSSSSSDSSSASKLSESDAEPCTSLSRHSQLPTWNLFVGDLPQAATEGDIRAAFSSIGCIDSVNMVFHPGTRTSKGYCFINFLSAAARNQALSQPDLRVLGRQVKLSKSESYAAKSPHFNNVANGVVVVPPPILWLSNVPRPLQQPEKAEQLRSQLSALINISIKKVVTKDIYVCCEFERQSDVEKAFEAFKDAPTFNLHKLRVSMTYPLADKDKEDACTLYVKNMDRETLEERLREAFRKYGDIDKCVVIRDPATKLSRGYGFVEMATGEQAQAAIEGLHNSEIDRAIVSVSLAEPSKHRKDEGPRSGRGGATRGGFGPFRGGLRGGITGGRGGFNASSSSFPPSDRGVGGGGVGPGGDREGGGYRDFRDRGGNDFRGGGGGGGGGDHYHHPSNSSYSSSHPPPYRGGGGGDRDRDFGREREAPRDSRYREDDYDYRGGGGREGGGGGRDPYAADYSSSSRYSSYPPPASSTSSRAYSSSSYDRDGRDRDYDRDRDYPPTSSSSSGHHHRDYSPPPVSSSSSSRSRSSYDYDTASSSSLPPTRSSRDYHDTDYPSSSSSSSSSRRERYGDEGGAIGSNGSGTGATGAPRPGYDDYGVAATVSAGGGGGATAVPYSRTSKNYRPGSPPSPTSSSAVASYSSSSRYGSSSRPSTSTGAAAGTGGYEDSYAGAGRNGTSSSSRYAGDYPASPPLASSSSSSSRGRSRSPPAHSSSSSSSSRHGSSRSGGSSSRHGHGSSSGGSEVYSGKRLRESDYSPPPSGEQRRRYD